MILLGKFKLIEKNNLKYYTIPAFENTGMVTAVFTTRWGGVSKEPYNTLNMGLHVGDMAEDVVENREIFAEQIGFSIDDLICAQQVHGSNIVIVDGSHRGLGSRDYNTAISETDAIITNKSGLALLTNYADCVPLYFFDPVKRVIALAHAGWKGTVAAIGVKTIKKMEEQFDSLAKNILVAIGPSIGPCCYEVDQRLYDEFSAAFSFAQEIFQPISDGKWKLNLWEANRLQVILSGVPEENIINSTICTCCNHDLLFSHRADKGLTGRLAAVLAIKNM